MIINAFDGSIFRDDFNGALSLLLEGCTSINIVTKINQNTQYNNKIFNKYTYRMNEVISSLGVVISYQIIEIRGSCMLNLARSHQNKKLICCWDSKSS